MVAVGAKLQNIVNGAAQPLSLYSWKLQPAHSRYNISGDGLLPIYFAIKHFQHILEG